MPTKEMEKYPWTWNGSEPKKRSPHRFNSDTARMAALKRHRSVPARPRAMSDASLVWISRKQLELLSSRTPSWLFPLFLLGWTLASCGVSVLVGMSL